jgi:phage tail-like protein
MSDGTSAYSSFNFIMSLDGPTGPMPFGGFSDVSGLDTHTGAPEYRDRDQAGASAGKVPGSHKAGDVTLKRGVVNAAILSDWIARTRTAGVSAQRNIIIALRDEANHPVLTWKLVEALPKKCAGAEPLGKGNEDVAIEELVLSAKRVELN